MPCRNLQRALVVLAFVATVDGFQRAGRLFVSSTLSPLQSKSVADKDDSSFAPSLSSTFLADASRATLPARHVRWHSSSTSSETAWDLQTAVTTWQNPTTGQKIELHALVHFGNESYYRKYNEPQFSADRTVLYELLLDETMLETTDKGYRRVTSPLSASLPDRQTAARYNWACQVDVLNYQQPQWRHADWTRGEFQQALQERQSINEDGDAAARQSQPVWQQVSSASAATEAATALFVGPPTMSDKDSRRRLFSNLFLPGSSLTQALRLALWMTVPAPELSILLLDWSSTYSSRNVWQASWSPIVRFLLQALWSARLDVVQRLVFGQVLLTGSRPSTSGTANNNNNNNNNNYNSPDNVAQSLLIQGRNQKALQVLDQTLQDSESSKVALLYGSSHCPDLSQSLRQRGFAFQSTTWHTAWSVQLKNNNHITRDGTDAAPLWLIPATLYLAASGADWLASWQAVGNASDDPAQMALLAGAYGIRHVLLYLGISKVVLDWQRPGGVE